MAGLGLWAGARGPVSLSKDGRSVCVSVNNAVMKWQHGRAEHARELPVGGGEPER